MANTARVDESHELEDRCNAIVCCFLAVLLDTIKVVVEAKME